MQERYRNISPFWHKAHRQVTQFAAPLNFHHAPSARFDVIIVGAGWKGLTAAAWLTKAGYRVCCLDETFGDNPSAHSGAFGLDLLEKDIRTLRDFFGDHEAADAAARKLIRASFEATRELQRLEQAFGFSSGYRPVGYVTAFLQPWQREEHKKMLHYVCAMVPEHYREEMFQWIDPGHTGSRSHRGGGVYTPVGGLFDPARVMLGLLNYLKEQRVPLYRAARVHDMEAASQGAVRVYAGERGQYELEGKRVILAGGKTDRLIARHVEDMPVTVDVATGMIRVIGVGRRLYKRVTHKLADNIPLQEAEVYTPAYMRSERAADGTYDIWFGGGGRMSGETQHIMKDIQGDLTARYPALEKAIEEGRARVEDVWHRDQQFSGNGFPYAVLFDPRTKTSPRLSEMAAPERHDLPPVIGLFGPGGHGNFWSMREGRLLAEGFVQGEQSALEVLATLDSLRPEKVTAHTLKRERKKEQWIKGAHWSRGKNRRRAKPKSENGLA